MCMLKIKVSKQVLTALVNTIATIVCLICAGCAMRLGSLTITDFEAEITGFDNIKE